MDFCSAEDGDSQESLSNSSIEDFDLEYSTVSKIQSVEVNTQKAFDVYVKKIPTMDQDGNEESTEC